MHLFLLGGNSKGNWEWINQVSEEFDSLFSDCTLQYYNRWEQEHDMEDSDIPLEAEKLKGLIMNLADEDYAILAKSIGAVVAMTAIREYGLKPRACFFFGLTTKESDETSEFFKGLLMDWNTPTLFGQNSDDPQGAMKQVRSLIVNCRVLNFETAEYSGSTHKYERLESIKEDVGRFLGRIN